MTPKRDTEKDVIFIIYLLHKREGVKLTEREKGYVLIDLEYGSAYMRENFRAEQLVLDGKGSILMARTKREP